MRVAPGWAWSCRGELAAEPGGPRCGDRVWKAKGVRAGLQGSGSGLRIVGESLRRSLGVQAGPGGSRGDWVRGLGGQIEGEGKRALGAGPEEFGPGSDVIEKSVYHTNFTGLL